MGNFQGFFERLKVPRLEGAAKSEGFSQVELFR